MHYALTQKTNDADMADLERSVHSSPRPVTSPMPLNNRFRLSRTGIVVSLNESNFVHSLRVARANSSRRDVLSGRRRLDWSVARRRNLMMTGYSIVADDRTGPQGRLDPAVKLLHKAAANCLLVGISCLTLWPLVACSQSPWETYNEAGSNAYEQGQYADAEKAWIAALEEAEKFGPRDPRLATSLNNLAILYDAQGKYAETEPLYKRALAIAEKTLGPDHLQVAIFLNNLADLYRLQGRYAESEPLSKRALAIEKVLGPDHPQAATTLNNLALLYQDQGQYEEAELLYKRSLAIREKALGPHHPEVATSLNNLAALYDAQGRYEEAEPLRASPGGL